MGGGLSRQMPAIPAPGPSRAVAAATPLTRSAHLLFGARRAPVLPGGGAAAQSAGWARRGGWSHRRAWCAVLGPPGLRWRQGQNVGDRAASGERNPPGGSGGGQRPALQVVDPRRAAAPRLAGISGAPATAGMFTFTVAVTGKARRPDHRAGQHHRRPL